MEGRWFFGSGPGRDSRMVEENTGTISDAKAMVIVVMQARGQCQSSRLQNCLAGDETLADVATTAGGV